MRPSVTVYTLAFVAVLSACSDPVSNCEVQVNGVGVCVEHQASMKFCESEWNGEATRADSSDDPTCAAMGYPVDCGGFLNDVGDNYEAQVAYTAATEEDCATAEDGSLNE